MAHEIDEDEIGEQSVTLKLQVLWEFTSYQTCLQTSQPFLRGTMSIGTAVQVLITIKVANVTTVLHESGLKEQENWLSQLGIIQARTKSSYEFLDVVVATLT